MYTWKKWIWPGIFTSVILTAGASFIKSEPIQEELSSGVTEQLTANHDWASINISARDITLSGKAPSKADVKEASKLAGNIYGVRVVNDETELIAEVKPYTLAAEKKDGKFTLSGFVPNKNERNNVLELAKKNGEGFEIVDDLSLARGNPENVSDINAYAIGALAGLASGAAKISDGSVSVTGAANEVSDYQDTLDYLSNAPSGIELGGQEIMPALVSPYLFSVEKGNGKIVLDGFMPSQEDINSVGEKFADANPDATLENNLQVALGAPDGTDWASVASQSSDIINMFENGAVSMRDAGFGLKGNLVEGGSLDALNEAINGTGLKGFDFADLGIVEPVVAAIEEPAQEETEEEQPSEPEIPTADPYIWGISKSESKITVFGSVTSDEERTSIIDGLTSTFAGIAVQDNQKLALGKPDGLDKLRIAVAKGVKFLESGTVKITGTDVKVFGKAKNNNLKNLATNGLLKNIPFNNGLDIDISAPQAVTAQVGEVEFVETPAAEENTAAEETAETSQEDETPTIATVEPYIWSVSKAEDKITLTGNVTSEEERTAVIETAKSTFGSAEVDDQQVLGLGKPDGYDAARTALTKGLKFLNEGQATISGTDANLIGVAKNDNIMNLVSRLVQKVMPDGYGLNLDLSSPQSNAVQAGEVVFNPQPLSQEGKACAADIREFIDGRVFNYAVDSVDFLTSSKDVADKLVAKMIECPEIHVSIEGHTDSYGTVEYNELLSDARANGIRDYLIKGGVDPSRIKAEGFGKSKPIASNRNPEGRAQNRRTLVLIVEE